MIVPRVLQPVVLQLEPALQLLLASMQGQLAELEAAVVLVLVLVSMVVAVGVLLVAVVEQGVGAVGLGVTLVCVLLPQCLWGLRGVWQRNGATVVRQQGRGVGATLCVTTPRAARATTALATKAST